MLTAQYFLKECHLESIINLNKLDCLSMMVASLCHDIGHDGFTNSFHSNMMTSRAIEANDYAV